MSHELQAMEYENMAFELTQRKAKAYASSDLVPATYHGNVANCVIAMELALRLKMQPLMIMQNLHIIHGRPSWSSSFIIACVNACGRFTPLRFEYKGEGQNRSCFAYATDKESNQECRSIKVDLKMAREEGWLTKKGSKWITMPDLMLQWRAASFFGRAYAPDFLMGIYSEDENDEIKRQEKDVTSAPQKETSTTNAYAALVDKETSEVKNQMPDVDDIKEDDEPAFE